MAVAHQVWAFVVKNGRRTPSPAFLKNGRRTSYFGHLKKISGFLTETLWRPADVREAAYKTLVRPQLEYGTTVWSPYTQSNIINTNE